MLALQALEHADTLEARNALHQALPELHLLRTIPAASSRRRSACRLQPGRNPPGQHRAPTAISKYGMHPLGAIA
ncbi:MAG: hypothetical protein MZV70_46575 [Desulfobacterales bacterium]|nr:hypothetical protein [Desulfobacterales bacterium]